jgi:hypothetical protein
MVMLFVLHCFITIGAPKTSWKIWELVLLYIVHSSCIAFGDSSKSYSLSPAQCTKDERTRPRIMWPIQIVHHVHLLLEAQEKLAPRHHILQSIAMTMVPSCASAMSLNDNISYTNKFLHWLHCDTEFTEVITYLQTMMLKSESDSTLNIRQPT